MLVVNISDNYFLLINLGIFDALQTFNMFIIKIISIISLL